MSPLDIDLVHRSHLLVLQNALDNSDEELRVIVQVLDEVLVDDSPSLGVGQHQVLLQTVIRSAIYN